MLKRPKPLQTKVQQLPKPCRTNELEETKMIVVAIPIAYFAVYYVIALIRTAIITAIAAVTAIATAATTAIAIAAIIVTVIVMTAADATRVFASHHTRLPIVESNLVGEPKVPLHW